MAKIWKMTTLKLTMESEVPQFHNPPLQLSYWQVPLIHEAPVGKVPHDVHVPALLPPQPCKYVPDITVWSEDQ